MLQLRQLNFQMVISETNTLTALDHKILTATELTNQIFKIRAKDYKVIHMSAIWGLQITYHASERTSSDPLYKIDKPLNVLT